MNEGEWTDDRDGLGGGATALFAGVWARRPPLCAREFSTPAYSSEVFLGALKVLSRGSVEAARALGLGRWHSFRFVVAPELFRLALPGLSNVVLSLVKQTSLLAVISYEELLRAAAIAAGSVHQPLFFYAVACVLYLALTAFVAVAFRRADLAANRGLRPT